VTVKDHISYSEWGGWLECPYKWFRDHLEGRRSEVFSIYMEFGKSVHWALETFKDPDVKDPNKWSTVDKICTEFEEQFRKNYKKVRDKDKREFSDKDIDDFVLAGIKIIRNIDSCSELANAKVLFVEYPLMIKIDRTDDVDMKFKGYIDIVIRSIDKRGKQIVWIVDYKTCSWGWNQNKRRDEHLMSQLRLYKHFFSKEFNLDPKQVRCAFILLKRICKTDDITEWAPVSAGPKTTMRAVKKLNESITGMQTGNYEKNRNACINPFGDKCAYMDSPLCTKD